MTRMKDSGIEWIGEVPEDWGIKPIKHIFAAIGSGTTPDSSKVEYYDGNINWLQSGDLYKKDYVYAVSKTITDLGYRSSASLRIYQAPFLAIAMYGASIGNLAISKIDACVNQAVAVLKGEENIVRFAKLALEISKTELIFAAQGGTQPNINQVLIKNWVIPFPSEIEIKKIADFLDKKVAQLDKIKSLLEEQIKTLEDYRKSLIYETVTKGLDKTVPLKDSGVDWIGQIPEGWGVGKLKYYFDVQLGKMLQPSAINGNDIEIDYLRAINVQWDNISVDNLSKMWCNPSEVSKYEIMNGDLLVCEGGEVGRCGIVEYLSDRAIIQNAVHRIRSAERANVRFLNYYIQHTTKSKWFDILCNKATIAHLTSEKLLNTLVVLPSISEQIQIADFLDKKTEQINQMIAIKKEQIENINKQRQTLIYDVVTGKRRI